MPKVAYSQEERAQIRANLVETCLDLISRQGIQHTTVEQVYKRAGISRTFFYSFFPTKEDLIVEALYLQQPKIVAYAQRLMADPSHSWREGVRQFLISCCYGEKNGIAVLTIEEQQQIFRRLSPDGRRIFREKQLRLFGRILEQFGVEADEPRVSLFTNLFLAVMVVRRAIPDTLPLFVPEAADATVRVQVEAILDCLEALRASPSSPGKV